MSKTRKIIFICAIIVMIAGIAFIVVRLVSQHNADEAYKDLQNKVDIPSEPEEPEPPVPPVDTTPEEPEEPDEPEVPEEPEIPEEPEEPEPEPYVSPIDFEELWETNEDIYAWVTIPDTKVDYPVLQHPTDDAYYLEHTVEGKYTLPGSIYSEKWNSKDFSDFLTIIYGHNMANGTMFGRLRKFRDLDYMREHQVVSFYTPEGEYHYKIFAAVTYSNAYLPNTFDYSTEEGRQAFIDSIKNVRDLNSYIDEDIEVTTDSRLVVLSTCVGNEKYRLLVVGVLDEEASTK